MATDSSKTAQLVQYARDVAATIDLFELLGVDATSSQDQIHKAWRRAALQHHPDRAGKDYDAQKYEALERARDVLIDPASREAYDRSRSAALQAKQRQSEMSSERRRLVEELEAAEKAGMRPAGGSSSGGGVAADENDDLTPAQRAENRRRFEEYKKKRRDAERAAEERDKAREARKEAEMDERIAKIERRLEEKAERRAAKEASRKHRQASADVDPVDADAASAKSPPPPPPPRSVGSASEPPPSRPATLPPEPGDNTPVWLLLENTMSIERQTMEDIKAAQFFATTALELPRSALQEIESGSHLSTDSLASVERCIAASSHWQATAQSILVSAQRADNFLMAAVKIVQPQLTAAFSSLDVDTRWDRGFSKTRAMAMARQTTNDAKTAAEATRAAAAAAQEAMRAAKGHGKDRSGDDSGVTAEGTMKTLFEGWVKAAEQLTSALTKAGESAKTAMDSLVKFVEMNGLKRPEGT